MIERERKFLVDAETVRSEIRARMLPHKIHTASYFTEPPLPAVRVTFSPTTGKGKFCIKFPIEGTKAERVEIEHTVPAESAQLAVEMGPTKLVKHRYDMDGWEIDCFQTFPLWLAEWEEHEGKEPIPDPLPKWIVQEVTDDLQYTNQALAWKHGLRKAA